jgi:hypothetical protein
MSDSNDWKSSGTWNTTISPSTARNVFTTAFVIINFAISFLGSYYLKRRVQRTLLSQDLGTWRTVPISYLTSWLSLGGVTSYVWKVRRIPGGILGWLMLWTGIFSLAHQYFVNSFILPQPQRSQCHFDRGIITTEHSGSVTPASTWPSALLVFVSPQVFIAYFSFPGVRGVKIISTLETSGLLTYSYCPYTPL